MRIRLRSMAPKRPKQPKKGERVSSPETSKVVDEIAATVRREVERRLSPNATFEQRQDIAYEIMRGVLWRRTDDDLQESVTEAEEVEVAGKRYRRLEQESSATYFGPWGQHHIEEPLFR